MDRIRTANLRVKAHTAGGFTLIELMVVMMILALLVAGVIPIFRGALTDTRIENSMEDLLTVCKAAQAFSISSLREHRVYIDSEQRAYWVARPTGTPGEPEFEAIAIAGDRRFRWPEKLELKRPRLPRDGRDGPHYLSFYPNGMASAAELEFSTGDGRGEGYRFELSGLMVDMERPER